MDGILEEKEQQLQEMHSRHNEVFFYYCFVYFD